MRRAGSLNRSGLAPRSEAEAFGWKKERFWNFWIGKFECHQKAESGNAGNKLAETHQFPDFCVPLMLSFVLVSTG